jgi:UDP-N-acetylmuramate dehydrogenase
MINNYFSLPKIEGKYRFNVDLSKTNWFGVGGKAKILFLPKDLSDLEFFLKERPSDLKIHILGVGSNIIITDEDLDACIIKLLSTEFNKMIINDKILEVGGAVLSKNLAIFCKNNSIGNLEFLTGIPGSIGGAIRMNSGCYGSEISDSIIKIEAINFNGEIFEFSREDCNFLYRENNLPKNLIFTKVYLKITKDDQGEISKKIDLYNKQREETQPIRSKTGGSTFKNPKSGKKAWQLIDEAGCRGKKIGDAHISEKHCNFMINTGSKNANDLIDLGNYVVDEVKEKHDIELEWEIKIID